MHHGTRNNTADGRGERGYDKAQSNRGGRLAANRLEIQGDHEEILEAKSTTRIIQGTWAKKENLPTA